MKTNALTTIALAVAATLALAGCSATAEQTPAPSASSTPSDTAASGGEAPDAIEIPTSAYGTRMTWILDLLNGTDAPTDAELSEAFDATTLEMLGGADGFSAVLDTQLRAVGPYTPVQYAEQPGAAQAVAATANGSFTISMSFDADDRLTGLLVSPYEEPPAPAADWAELEGRVDALGVDARVSVFDISSGEVGDPVHTFGELTGTAPSGSTFKLFVLRAVVDAVAAGSLTWDTPLTVTDAVRSLPSGTYQDEETGTTHTVREAAGVMISQSDNTATDMLIGAVGREAVESVMVDLQIDGAKQNTPFATTRAFFEIGWGAAGLRERWAAADTAERTAILTEVAEAPLTVQVQGITQPVWQDGIDWFYSDRDLAVILADLHRLADTDAGAELPAILEANPGVPFADDWDAVQFKGGSSIGVLAGAWLLEEGDRTYAIIVQLATDEVAQAPTMGEFADLAVSSGGLLFDE